jgi:phosphatidylserine/phosphatidylglycerophosphate/cardiolipin synthase-like enzyme
MTSTLCLLTTEDLQQLAAALRSGRVVPPINALLLRRYVPTSLADRVTEELRQRIDAGFHPAHLADMLDILSQDRRQRPVAEDLIDLVWTGPEVEGIVNRDTGVVVREMFQAARESVLVAGYAVYQGQVIFKALAERMDQNSQLDVQMYLDIQRSPHDQSSPSELVRRFAERFVRHEWPGQRFPRVFYDPRSLETEPTRRASLHAKCIVVDQEVAFVSSANFTEAAQTKNIEVGVCVRSPAFARRLTEHFEILASTHELQPVPLSLA